MLTDKHKVSLPFLLVAFTCILRVLIYLYVGIAGAGNFVLEHYVGILVNVIFYTFILTDSYKFFIKGKNITLNPLIFKYGIANLATLIGLRNGDNTIFMLTALMLFLVPYVSDNVYAKKNRRALTAVTVLLCSMTVSVLYMMHPATNYFAELGTLIYNLDALNPTIEWFLIVYLLSTKKKYSKKGE